MSNPKAHPPTVSHMEPVNTTITNDREDARRSQTQSPWVCSLTTLAASILGLTTLLLMVQSFLTKQLDAKGCEMAYMRPMYQKFDSFDTEHTRLASKYSLYLYREWGIDEEFTVKGVPVLFIPGNAGSYKQVRSFASEAAYHYHNSVQNEQDATAKKRPLDFFSVDFNEDFTAFHGQTLLDQAEYLNDAITFILSLYHTPGSVQRDSHLPDPTSVIIVGHSMGGVVARTMFTMPNYPPSSINTIVTLAAPHARPPVSFDGDIVRIYKGVNNYWRTAYTQGSAANPLDHVTLVSIAGGGLDTIVSSDYASLASLIPDTHGFTVFTSSIPNVWTGMDHLAITWCDQARKAVVRALYDVIDVSSATQTIPRQSRMEGFRKWLLTGLEEGVEKNLLNHDINTLLIMEDNRPNVVEEKRLILPSLGFSDRKPNVFLIPIPSGDDASPSSFSLLTSEKLTSTDNSNNLDVLICLDLSKSSGQTTYHFTVNLDLSGDEPGSTQLGCKNAANDVIILPQSTSQSDSPFRTDQNTYSYLQYDMADLGEYHFIAVVDRSGVHHAGWVIAEFNSEPTRAIKLDISLPRLLLNGVTATLPSQRPTSLHVHVPALHSSLLAYDLHVSRQTCERGELFAPLVRQYITDVHESKFFVNAENAKINLHGISPYLPQALSSNPQSNGLSLQIWTDPSCNSEVRVDLRADVLGSLGKLWMRYRIVFAAFPIFIVALIIRHQFRTYDQTGVFISFAQGMNDSLTSTIPLALTALTLLSIMLATTRQNSTKQHSPDDITHELLLGNDDPFFWFLVPLFGLMCIAFCVLLNYLVLALEHLFAITATSILGPRPISPRTPNRRILTTLILASQLTTIIPYHAAYVLLTITHLLTTTTHLRTARSNPSPPTSNLHAYAHTLLILLLLLLPINIPVLVVWLRNLSVHYLTPFSAHHNLLAIMPYALLVETVGAGNMVPRSGFGVSFLGNVGLVAVAGYAAVYGVSYAFVLHWLGAVVAAWLVGVHFNGGRVDGEEKKAP